MCFEWRGELAKERGGRKHISVLLQIYYLAVKALGAQLRRRRANWLNALGSPPNAYARLARPWAPVGWICQGTGVRRPLRRKVGGQGVNQGPYYLWTGKRQGKTVCYALSQAQYEVARQAIAAHRRVLQTWAKLPTRTLEHILKQLPGVQKRK